MNDLISRDAVIELMCQPIGPTKLHEAICALPKIRPTVVANISGGVLQGASSDYPVEIISLDFDTDTFDEDNTGVIIDGSEAYRSDQVAEVDPEFVKEVQEADEVFLHNGAKVCTECDGTKKVYGPDFKPIGPCKHCDGSGEEPTDA